MSSLTFNLSSSTSTSRFGPRLGNIIFGANTSHPRSLPTPGIITTTSRGVVPHLSQDHVYQTEAIKWIHVPFESFLEQSPPILTRLPDGTKNALHSFLGYSESKHILSMSIRDPYDSLEMPPNGKGFISARCMRGVRKVTVSDWKSYMSSCHPDIAVSMTDTLLSKPPYSQKRITKSIERSCTWLLDLVAPQHSAPSVTLVPMAGGASIPARRAFSTTLVETLYGKEEELAKPLKCLDEGASGYVFDLVPLRLELSLHVQRNVEQNDPVLDDTMNPSSTHAAAIPISAMYELLHASLEPLPDHKVRILNSVTSPHEILQFICQVGVDMFDAHWAQRAADIGVALDFVLPVPADNDRKGKHSIGHNLYDSIYAHDFSSLSNSTARCKCLACLPRSPSSYILHSSVDKFSFDAEERSGQQAFSKAFLHHLLHTHEMSAHSLLVMHNLTQLDSFFADIRRVIEKGKEAYNEAVDVFCSYYDETLQVFDQAQVAWYEVEMARGKGRLAREKAKQAESVLGTAVEL